MLKHRIIPILLTDGKGNCVKPVQFQRPYRRVGSLMQYVKMFERRNIDELIILDIEATKENRLIDCEKIKEYTKELFCPLTLGGGIKSLDDINKLLQSGADKVAIDSSSITIGADAAHKFGSQCIVGVANTRKNKKGNYLYMYGLSEPIPMFIERAIDVLTNNQRFGEILFTDMDLDGTMQGYNLELIARITRELSVPLIVSGGCSEPSDMAKAIRAGASAVAASSVFLFKDITPKDCAEYLNKEGIGVRL